MVFPDSSMELMSCSTPMTRPFSSSMGITSMEAVR